MIDSTVAKEIITIKKVRSSFDRRRFVTFPYRIYQNDPLWVPPLIPEKLKSIDPKKGVFFKRGEADFFLAYKNGRLTGTICAAVDHPTNEQRGKNQGIFGFFECIDDIETAQALFSTAEEWMRARGLDELTGPFNLDYEDGYGILIEGRDRPPVLLCGHTAPYYKELVENCGFKPARAENIAYAFDMESQNPELGRLKKVADVVTKRRSFSVRGARFDRLDEEIDHILFLLDQSLGQNENFIPWYRESLEEMLQPFVDFADPELILFIEHKEKVIGWFPGLPNMNEVLIHANGLRCPWDYLKVFAKRKLRPKCLTVKSVLLLPEYQKTGAGPLLFWELYKRAKERDYSWIDLSLTSVDNPDTPKLAERFGAKIYKRYQVYKKDVKRK